MLIDHRGDISGRSAEPGRIILNFHVDDARAAAQHLGVLGATWLTEVEQRKDGLFGTLLDPDGNIIQIIELSASYLARQDRGEQTSENRSA